MICKPNKKEMNIEEFREYCLSFKGVHEKMPFPNVPDQYSRDVLCFYVADKWFCFVNIEIFDFCCIKCNPDESGELQTEYTGIRPGWHMNKKYWISVYFNEDVSDDKIKELEGDFSEFITFLKLTNEINKANPEQTANRRNFAWLAVEDVNGGKLS